MARGEIDNSMWGAAQDRVSFIDAHVNKAVATLKGDRGSTMLCRFTLNEPGVGPDRGGTVQCQLSTGGNFDANF